MPTLLQLWPFWVGNRDLKKFEVDSSFGNRYEYTTPPWWWKEWLTALLNLSMELLSLRKAKACIHLQVILSGSYFSRKKVEALTAIPAQIQARITATTPCFGFTERYVLGLTTAIQRSIVNDTQVNMEI
jgi:hypothetical protein